MIAMRLAALNGLNSELLFRALWRREQAASTAIGHGIALPHARVSGIDQPILLLARSRQPIVFGAPDGRPVSILFAIVVPEHANDDHLQILASVAERLSSDALRTQLRRAANPSAVKELFEWRCPKGAGRDVAPPRPDRPCREQWRCSPSFTSAC